MKPANQRAAEIGLAAGAAILFAAAIVAARDWPFATALFPIVLGIAGLGLALVAIAADLLQRSAASEHPQRQAVADDSSDTHGEGSRWRSFIWIGVFFVTALLFGFQIGLPAATLAYYRIEAQLRWITSILAGGACAGLLYLAKHVLTISLYEGLIFAGW